MNARLSPEARAAYDAWTESTIEKAEHLLRCREGCSDLMVRCQSGQALAEQERAIWRAYYDARTPAEVPS